MQNCPPAADVTAAHPTLVAMTQSEDDGSAAPSLMSMILMSLLGVAANRGLVAVPVASTLPAEHCFWVDHLYTLAAQ